MSEPLHVAPRPCNSCPYLRSTPSGVWGAHEYRKLPMFDGDSIELAVFHCHQENATGIPTACHGWLAVHSDSIAVRVASATGHIDPSTIPPHGRELYDTGAEACAAGLRDVENPSDEARALVAKLIKRGVGS